MFFLEFLEKFVQLKKKGYWFLINTSINFRNINSRKGKERKNLSAMNFVVNWDRREREKERGKEKG